MDCHEARQLIDELLHQSGAKQDADVGSAVRTKSTGEGAGDDRSQLEAHLAKCPKCKAEWNELAQTRNLLAELASEAPTDQEKKTMWNAIATTAQIDVSAIARVWFHPWIRHFAAACIAFGVILATAFLLGQQKYGDVSHSAICLHNLREIGNSLSLYRVENDGWFEPLYPSYLSDGSQVVTYDDHVSRAEEAEKRQQTLSHIKSIATSSRVYEADDPNGWGIPVHPNQLVYDSRGSSGDESRYVGAYEWGGTDPRQFEKPARVIKERAKRTAEVKKRRHGGRRIRAVSPTPPASQGPVFAADAASGTSSSSQELEEEEVVLYEQSLDLTWQPGGNAGLGVSMPEGSAASEHSVRKPHGEIRWQPVDSTGNINNLSGVGDEGVVNIELTRDGVVLSNGAPGVVSILGTPAETQVVAGTSPLLDDADKLIAAMTQSTPSAGEPDAGEEIPPQPQRRQVQTKIIKNGQLSVEVDVYTEAIQRVERIVGQHGGFLADVNTEEQAGGALSGQLVIRCTPESFEGLFAALKTLGRVESENAKAADVTAEYVDVEARIHSLRIAEQRLQELIKSKSFVDKMSSLLEVEQEMTRVRSQIEQHQGRLRVMQDRIAMSTITMTLHEPARTVPSASLTIEVSQLDHASDALGEVLFRLDGRLASGKTAKRSDGSLKGEYWIHISLASFDELLEAIEGLGRIDDRQVRDRRMGDASKPWAKKVLCNVGLELHERAYQRPSGWMRIEVDSVEAAATQLESALAESGASIVSNETSQQDDGRNVAELQLRVRAGRFGIMVDSLDPLGRTTGKNIVGDVGTIIGGAADMLCDLSLTLSERPRQVPSGYITIEVADFGTARKQLSEVIGKKGAQVLGSSSDQRADGTWRGAFQLGVKAGEMEEFVSRVELLGRVASRQITGLGLGDLSQADPDALGTISLALAEKSTIRPPPDRTGLSLRSRLRDGIGGLYNSLGLIAYGLMVIAPWLIIVVGLAWLVTRSRRKRSAGA